ncbi:MAG: response regulator [Betaproteobacteria bacterium]|nr:response regulator [Betaproteobacteria bacterium]
MLENFANYFGTSNFSPHGYCFFWSPLLLWTYVVSDLTIAASYFSIPFALWYFVQKRPDVPFRWIFVLFGAFVLACGTTHLAGLWNIWHVDYWADAAVKALTASVSVVTAILLWPLIPKALTIPSHAQLESANRELQTEVMRRTQAESELRAVNDDLERRASERTVELRTREAELLRFRMAMDATEDAIYMVDRSSMRFIDVSAAACRMLGLTREQILAAGPDGVLSMPREELGRIYDSVIASGGAMQAVEMLRTRSDGTQVWVELRRHAAQFESGWTIVTVVRDITERKRLEAARASLEAQLCESQKMEAVGTLAGGIAHDFNNALATILGNVELARQDASTNPSALESLDEIRKAGARTRDLVQQILSFSRKQPIERRLTALAPIVEESVHLLRASLPARLTLEVKCDTDVPPVLADAAQIQQVLINLATNAMHAMHGRSGRIGIRLDTVMLDAALADAHPALGAMHARRPGSAVRITVSDDGSGMDAATLARIFEPFFTTKLAGEGTGLGLSVVHGIAQVHEGAITVDSAPGKGATFTLYLPAERRSELRAPEPDEGAAVAAPDMGGGQHILYIDDDESLVFLVRRLLERRGYRVSGYTNPGEALAALRAHPQLFDLVVTDYNMPGMSGLDVAREVRAIRGNLPVAVASGFIDQTLRSQAAGAGVRELIFKADAAEDLCEAFARLAQTAGAKSKSS